MVKTHEVGTIRIEESAFKIESYPSNSVITLSWAGFTSYTVSPQRWCTLDKHTTRLHMTDGRVINQKHEK